MRVYSLKVGQPAQPKVAPQADLAMAGRPPAATLPDKPSIAVLAFDNLSGDPEQEYFSDGISEDIITDLSMLSELHVVARNSSFVYKKTAVSVPDAAKALGARFVLEGSVRKAGNRVRVTAQLIDLRSGGHVWANRFDRDLTDIFAVQDELTHEIVTALKLKLTVGEQDRLARKRAVNVKAYEYLLRGREQALALTRGGNIAARSLADAAIAIDPEYAAAHALIAFTHLNDYANGFTSDPQQSLQIGLELAQRAVVMDEEEPAGHLALGIGYVWSWDLDRARAEALRGLALSPNSVELLILMANVQIFSGDPAAAVQTLTRPCAWIRTTRISRCNFLPTRDSPSASTNRRLSRSSSGSHGIPNQRLLMPCSHRAMASSAGRTTPAKPGNGRRRSIQAFPSSAADASNPSRTRRISSFVSKGCARPDCRSDARAELRAALTPGAKKASLLDCASDAAATCGGSSWTS